jgi:protein-S-isoprenylcysteine O-methyltransferase Ste14
MELIALLRAGALALMALGALCFVDAPLRTFGQKWRATRSRERTILLTLELDLYALWALAKFYLHWERALLPAAAEAALASAGVLAVLAGVVLAAWAKLRLGRWFSGTFGVKEGHVLVTDGPYALVRHPIYTGIVTTILGAALLWNSLLTLVLAALMAVPLFFHTVYEEALFEQHFGDAYRAYQRRVPRLVPFARPTPR